MLPWMVLHSVHTEEWPLWVKTVKPGGKVGGEWERQRVLALIKHITCMNEILKQSKERHIVKGTWS